MPDGWDLTSATCNDGSNPASIAIDPGETITCTFENTKQGGLTVVKNTAGGDGTFKFSSGELGAFSLATVAGTASRTFASLQPGSYSLAESTKKGWDPTGATCDDGSNPASIDIAAGEVVTCTFENTKRGQLIVVKNAAGGNGSFSFSSQTLTPTPFNLVTTGGTAQRSFTNLLPGTYDVTETTPAGWDLTSATCSDGSTPASIAVAPGETVTCTFENAKRGSLTVVKSTVGGDGAFSFTSQTLGAFSLTTVNGKAQSVFTNLVPGTYDVSESVPAGWELTSATCSNGSNPASIAIGPGENVTCTFKNMKLDTIIVVKRAVGGDATFQFTSTALNNFSLTTVNGEAQRSFSNLAPGTYAVAESALAGWTATEADPTCSNGDRASSIDLGAGETVVCVFVNLKQDTIVVEKQAVGGDGVFSFTSPQLGPFGLTTSNGAASQSFTGLAAGSYAISESAPQGWVQTRATCDNGQAPGSLSLAPGQTVKCTFENTKLGSITVVKRTSGGDGTFQFTGNLGTFNLNTTAGSAQQSFGDLLPDSYSVTESIPAGWDLSSATCDNGDAPGNINLDAGENVTCTFENTKRGSLTVVKKTVGDDGMFDFTSQSLGDFTLMTFNQTAQQLFVGLVPGTYDVSESVPEGWSLSSATCSNGSDPATIAIGPGENVTCTFTNTKLNTIIVVKRAVGGDDTFQFTSQTLNNFRLTTANGEAQRRLNNLTAGTYDVSESVPAGWTLISATCSDGSNPASIDLSAGETVLCVFINLKQDTIVVEKRAVGGDGVFSFNSPQLGAFDLTTSNGAASQSFTGLAAGSYAIGESAPPGWVQTGATCDNGQAPGSISLAPGADGEMHLREHQAEPDHGGQANQRRRWNLSVYRRPGYLQLEHDGWLGPAELRRPAAR